MLRLLLSAHLILLSLGAAAQVKGPRFGDPVSRTLRERMLRMRNGDSITVSLSGKPGSNFIQTAPFLRKLAHYAPADIAAARVALQDLQHLQYHPGVQFMDVVYPAKEELTTGAFDLSLNRINYVHRVYPFLRGDSIRISVKERLFDTTDIDLQHRVLKTGIEPAGQTAHASLMATMAAGAGNSSPFALGAAPAAVLTSSDFLRLLPDPDSVFLHHGITVQNHSYGTIIEQHYGNEAAAYDRSANNLPGLLHVFSSGNTGTAAAPSAPYTGIPGYGNLTGNFKSAKNVLVVGAADSLGTVMELSSKGPVSDGRLKPELVAFGEDGSSGAAALVSGTAALLQQAYRRTVGRLPSSALVKAVLLNSARDIGQPEVDYAAGFGNLDAFRAVTTVMDKRTLEDTLSSGATVSFPLTIPANTALLKLTLVWNDPAAAPNASRALVNDLDVELVRSASGQTWLPWVLHPFPHADSLNQPAFRGRDTLNNAEQVTVQQPSPGAYVIRVKGSKVAGNQSFALAWQMDTAGTFYWTYPTATDGLVSGQAHTLRWDSNIPGAGQVAYSLNGQDWIALATAPLGAEALRWTLPDTAALLQLRIEAGNRFFYSDTLVIGPALELNVGFNCTDSFQLHWNSGGVPRFQLYALTGSYLQPVLQTGDTVLVLSRSAYAAKHFSVAPLVGSRPGQRSFTVDYTAQGAGCYITGFFFTARQNNTAQFEAILGTSLGIRSVSLEKWVEGTYRTVQSVDAPTLTRLSFSDASLIPGENRYRLRVLLRDGRVVYSQDELVYYTDPAVPVLIYPNPAGRGRVIQFLAAESGRYTLSIWDASGRARHTQVLNHTVTVLPGGLLSAGFYFVRITDRDGGSWTSKLVVF